MPKALALISGGLDSILACKIILEQNVDVIGINFVTPFCTCTKKGCRHEARKAAEQLGINLKIVPVGEDYIQMLKKPNHGYGSAMNPCIDCRIYTFRLARKYMEEIGAQFIITGEVLGERPMSQHFQSLKLIEKKSGLTGRVLRPLSAKLLEPTVPEIQGLVDRGKLLAIQGRSRKPQIALAEKFGIKEYPCPAGGCLLTDKNFARRLKEAFDHNEETIWDMKILRVGRHFRLHSEKKVVVGRNEMENRILTNLATKQDSILEPVDIPGPLTILIKSHSPKDIAIAARLCARYSDGKDLPAIKVRCDDQLITATPLDEPLLTQIRID